MSQSLSGGGWLASEYPLAVKLRYRDDSGNEATLVRGFYMQNQENRPTLGGQLVPGGIWVPFTVDLFDHIQVNPRPLHILWLEIEASGWEYESYATNIQLVAE